MKNRIVLLVIVATTFSFCDETPKAVMEEVQNGEVTLEEKQLTIFFINDQHGQINNFAKVKHIVDAEKAKSNALLVCAGDMFSGNPIVDQYEDKGFPMIDVMNKTGFDVAVLGNHEFDYGVSALKDRMNQAEFMWVCANVDMQESGVPQPDPFVTIDLDSLKITFLGLVETFGKPGAVIPATHPWRVSELLFQRHYDVVSQYENLKSEEESDLVIALTHLGSRSDRDLAEDASFIDLVIGGHSHEQINEKVNNTPVVQAGSYLNLLGRIDLKIKNQKVIESNVSFIDLENFSSEDTALAELIATYNDAPEFEVVVGYAEADYGRSELGCFYTEALMNYMSVDASFQNGGGIRSNIDQGDITTMEIYQMDPFNNQSVIFTMTAGEVSDFFRETGTGLHVSGISFDRDGDRLFILDSEGNRYAESDIITVGINDYIPSVHDTYFPLSKAEVQELTTAETIIDYLKTINSTVDKEGCDRYFRY